jgi:penicillin-binding protein 1A
MSPLEMASAYATFANDGVYREPFAYTSVTDSAGTVVMEKSVLSRQVYSAETAYLMSSMLEDVITKGTAKGKVLPITTDSGEAIAVAGKTGTTDNNVDKWFCGYTPYYSAATWYGYDNRLRTTEIPPDDRSNAQLIWNDAMQAIHKTLTPSTMTTAPLFVQPETVVELTICTRTGMLATDSCSLLGSAVTDLFDTKSPLTPTTFCYGHATPTPVPTEVPVVTAPIEPIVPVQP